MSIKVESSLGDSVRPSIDERLPLHNQCVSSIDTSLAELGNKYDDDLASLSIKCEFDDNRIDPFPVYGVLDLNDSDGMACFSGLNSNDCQICLNSLSTCSAPSPHFCSSTLSQSSSPSSHMSSASSPSEPPSLLLPQLDWVDVQSQLTCDLDFDPELSQLPCLSMDEVCGSGSRQPSSPDSPPLVAAGSLLDTANLAHFEQQHRREEESRAAANLFDKVLLTDCMLSASSAHHTMLAGRSRCHSFGDLSDSSTFRPDTPLSETETPADAASLASDELLSDVIPALADTATAGSPPRVAPALGRPALASVRIVSRPATTTAAANAQSLSSRSLLKRNHQRVAVQHAAVSGRGDAGDHSYSAAQQRGTRTARVVGPFDMLTPSPSQSEHSSDDDMDIMAVSNTWCRRKRMRLDAALCDRLAPSEFFPARADVTGTDECGVPLNERLCSGAAVRGSVLSGSVSASSAAVVCQPERRHNHNSMERMRRDLLRDYLHTLRCLVPVTSANERAPKVTVLREAAKFCLQLRAKEEQLAAQKRQLQLENARLYKQLQAAGGAQQRGPVVWRGSVRRAGVVTNLI